jgi:DNA-binding NtrC family response regulator
MNKNGPIIIIEDDVDDRDFLKEIFMKLAYPNELIFFEDGSAALEFLNQTEVLPFLILSDINMPKINGIELRKLIHENERLHLKCIPYLFLTTNANKSSVVDAYSMSVQGFFVKPSSYDKMESSIKKIMEYWKECIAPSEYENR